MKAIFSKVSMDGDVTWDPRKGSLDGLVRVENLTLDSGRLKAEIEIAGNIIFDGLDPEEDDFNQGRKKMEGVVSSIDDASLSSSHECPKEFGVFGRMKFGNTLIPFRGRFHPTGYFKQAWTSLTDPSWTGDRYF